MTVPHIVGGECFPFRTSISIFFLIVFKKGYGIKPCIFGCGCFGVGCSAVAYGSAGTPGSVGSRRMYGMRSLSWKALWNLREIRGGRLSAKVRGTISASMIKGPEALGASGCFGRS